MGKVGEMGTERVREKKDLQLRTSELQGNSRSIKKNTHTYIWVV